MELYIWSEDELIEYAKTYLKERGFKKKNKRWTKDIGEFTISFLIQGSCYSKSNYYIRPGVFINALMPTQLNYGHWMTEITPNNPEEVMHEFEKWCKEWTDKSLVKERLLAFIDWEERNPLEKRRAKLVDYETNPVPAQEFFELDYETKQLILDNF